MAPDEFLVRYRRETDDIDTQAPLWSDEEILNWAGEAEIEFCRLTNGISDARTEEVCQVDVVPGTQWYTLHASILKIRRVHRGDTGREVDLINVEDMAARGWRFDGIAGTLKALVVGLEEHAVRVYPNANETVTLNLTVFRKPLAPPSAENDNNPFEIAAEHHPFLLHWAKYLGYSKQDAETFDRTKAAEHKALFEAYCDRVKTEQGRLRHKPRAVQYGGL
jgi:hypothetical protein